MSARRPANPQDEFERIVALITKERRHHAFEAVRSLWRVGDAIRQLKESVAEGRWGDTLESCAARVGMRPGSLVDAARAARAFSLTELDELSDRLDRAGVSIHPSHVVVLSRASPKHMARGIDALLKNGYTVRQLRTYLRGAIV